MPLFLPKTVVLDTNVLVASAYGEGSASRQIVEACLRGELTAVVSPALRAEYDLILARAIWVRGYDQALARFVEHATLVEPPATPRVVPGDAEDDKLIAVAVAAAADAVVTNDRHLLTLDPYGDIRILRPTEFLRLWRPS
jgi:putative PIN family toxin of toxin-antitoxin system